MGDWIPLNIVPDEKMIPTIEIYWPEGLSEAHQLLYSNYVAKVRREITEAEIKQPTLADATFQDGTRGQVMVYPIRLKMVETDLITGRVTEYAGSGQVLWSEGKVIKPGWNWPGEEHEVLNGGLPGMLSDENVYSRHSE